jgi:hypothetical protein
MEGGSIPSNLQWDVGNSLKLSKVDLKDSDAEELWGANLF